MVTRTFFDRDNVIIYNNLTNTGRNEIAQLFYGGPVGDETYSRLIFHFDETKLVERHNDGTYCDLSKLKHTLKLTNTGSFDNELLGKTRCGGMMRTSSFDLILFKVNQEWDDRFRSYVHNLI